MGFLCAGLHGARQIHDLCTDVRRIPNMWRQTDLQRNIFMIMVSYISFASDDPAAVLKTLQERAVRGNPLHRGGQDCRRCRKVS